MVQIFVYFIQKKAEKLSKVKIGKSIYPKNRIKDIQTASDIKLNKLGYIEYDDEEENLELEMHELFKEYKAEKGEWFIIDVETLINTLKENGYFERFLKNIDHLFIPDLVCPQECGQKFNKQWRLERHLKENRVCKLGLQIDKKDEIISILYNKCIKYKKRNNELIQSINDDDDDLRTQIMELEIRLDEREKTIEKLLLIFSKNN